MKIKLSIIVIAVSLLNGALAFVVTWNFIIGLAATAIFLFIGLCLIIQLIVGYLEKERKRHESYRFVNGFLITLSVSKSPEEAFQSGLIGGGPELLAIAQSVGDYSVGDRLEYLKSYFLEPYYLLLVSLFALFEEQGGDPLALGQSLLEEATRSEKSDDEQRKEGLSKLGEFLSLWFLSGLIILFVRVCLRSFAPSLVENPLYLVCASLYFVLAVVSYLLFTMAFTEAKPTLRRASHVETLAKKED